jgi:hypothetical protein
MWNVSSAQARDRLQTLRHQRPIHIVFDDRHAMPARNVDERHPALETHRYDCRVLQIRHREDGLHRHAPARALNCVGEQTIAVAWDADDFKLENRRKRFQAIVS